MARSSVIQTASHWGVYGVEVSDQGDILGVQPFGADPAPTPLMHSLPDMARSSLRISQPHVRAGYLRRREQSRQDRGADAYVPVSWDLALDLVQQGLERIKAEHGNQAIYGGSYGWASAGRLHHAPSVLKRFLGLYGGYVDKRGTHSFGAAQCIMPYVVGDANVPSMAAPWPSIVEHTDLVVMFGGAHVKNMQVDSGGAVLHENPGWIERAAAAGTRFVNISPARADGPEPLNARWLAIRPNTDVAMMLGLAHVLVQRQLHDRAFLQTYCAGYPVFERYLLGTDDGIPKNAQWAASITGVDASAIEALAVEMARGRTLITTSWSIQRAQYGEQPVWMTVTLAAMLGQIGLPGGGYSLGFGAINGTTASRPAGIPRPTLPLGHNPVTDFIPVGRVADMLLNPGGTLEYDGQTLQLPDIRAVYSVGGNPFHHNTNLNRFVQAWRRPELVVVHEPWWSPPAKYADIVLPATTTLERNDILAADLQRHYIAMYQAIDPVGGARNDFDIFAELAERLGFAAAYTEGRTEMQWLRHMYDKARARAQTQGYAPPEFDEFWRVGHYEFPLPPQERTLLADFRADPVAHALPTPSGKIEIYSARIASYGYDDCPPHPCWLEPDEWLGAALTQRFPLHLLTNQPHARLHSQMDAGKVSRAAKYGEREPLTLHPQDAAQRGISEGDIVRVYNDRGAFLATARIASDQMPGVAHIATGAWFDPDDPTAEQPLEKHGNPNVVTLDGGCSRLSQGPIAQTVLVQIERCTDAPAVTAFEPPRLEPAPPPV